MDLNTVRHYLTPELQRAFQGTEEGMQQLMDLFRKSEIKMPFAAIAVAHNEGDWWDDQKLRERLSGGSDALHKPDGEPLLENR